MVKLRADERLVREGLAATRSKAQALILSGSVYAGGELVSKAGTRIEDTVRLEVKSRIPSYVSRGGNKLEGAIQSFGISVAGLAALDVGASTGGFTDCLLKHGARKVFAVDVGHGQLDWSLRNDPRVVVLEKTNARNLTKSTLGESIAIAVIDASFISLTLLIPPVLNVLEPRGLVVALIKPQFEVGRAEVGKGGVVKDPEKHLRVCRKIEEFVLELGCEPVGVIESPLLGPKGNKEFFIAFYKGVNQP
ncbi:MAG: TlyA family RNA methyltransferase [Deltaproteobacteria bacterium]|nr:TlyA family RNA methyltransferase [Deltaproteobacteria bacterium]